MPTAAHPVLGDGKRAEMCRERSFDSVLELWDEATAKQRSVFFAGLRWQNCVVGEVEAEPAEDAESRSKVGQNQKGIRAFIFMIL
jgi:hypothetical protein